VEELKGKAGDKLKKKENDTISNAPNTKLVNNLQYDGALYQQTEIGRPQVIR
jgi:hypothetical protein